MPINSRQKGKAGELELCQFLRARGFSGARRSQQYKGTPESADIVGALPGFHIECKRVETFQLYKALAQAQKDKASHDIALVCHRRNREEWVAVLSLEDLLGLINDPIYYASAGPSA